MPDRPAITPELRVSALLDSYPELEAVLVSLSPTYQALSNPVLRRTVARVATLHQVAKVGNVGIGALINRLREAAGQASCPHEDELDHAHTHGHDAPPSAGEPPAWAQVADVKSTFDAREIIAGGGHPMQRVMSDLTALAPQDVYLLVTPFVPAPLVDLAAGKGFAAFSELLGPELVHTYFRRA
jgi:hypothetical protein